ncbi:hypothetical protein pmac_cds_877 [Pandoravirus macleodensis]|uniref:Uncharacterized protein n=1 Tax=Pandoravirus macleodensis TaxID=2107707 RepID=A0A2U7UGM5_9VIRU|nr:hypothetical protein pmac_cds_877 [Pandoravirus macleodensis]AVK77565.1 hypothetical protein pmac_cds_877 [Pandoravirus macleodensis]UMO80376.1 hypothetical protein [Pandoravirus aubagnensis]
MGRMTRRAIWAMAAAWIAACATADLCLGILLVATLLRRAHDNEHAGGDDGGDDYEAGRIVAAMAWIAMGAFSALPFAWFALRDAARSRFHMRISRNQLHYVCGRELIDPHGDPIDSHGPSRSDALLALLDKHTWHGHPQRTRTLCHRSWRVRQTSDHGDGVFSFAGNGLDDMGAFRVLGCGNTQGCGDTVRMAWSQIYDDRKGVMGAERYSFEFRGVLALDAEEKATITGAWMPCAVDDSDKRCGDIARGLFWLYPRPTSGAPFADATAREREPSPP